MIDPPWIKPPPPPRLGAPVRPNDEKPQLTEALIRQDDAQFLRDAAIFRVLSRKPTPR
jgi:hypothetical protein